MSRPRRVHANIALTVAIGLDQAGIDGESLAADQTSLDARPHHALKHATEDQRPCGPNLSTSHVGGAVVLTRFYGDSSVSPQLAGVACERSVSASKEKLN